MSEKLTHIDRSEIVVSNLLANLKDLLQNLSETTHPEFSDSDDPEFLDTDARITQLIDVFEKLSELHPEDYDLLVFNYLIQQHPEINLETRKRAIQILYELGDPRES